jgi:photosystem II stability/assembly factor-like uncharacterized protein
MKTVILFLFVTLVTVANAQWEKGFKLGDTYPYNIVKVNDKLFMRDNYSMWKSSDSGMNWETIAFNIPEGNGYTGKETFESDGKNLFVLYTSDEYDAVYCSNDEGINWNCALKTEHYTYKRICCIDGKVYLTTHKKGYFTSDDGGKSWQSHASLLIDGKSEHPDFQHVVSMNGKTFIAQNPTGVVVSIDGEKSFKTIQALKTDHQADLFKAGKYLIVAYPAFVQNDWRYGIKVSDDEGVTWTEFNYNFELNSQSNQIKNAVEYNGILYISVTGGVLCSSDGGKTWQNQNKEFYQSGRMYLVNGTLLLATWQYVYSLKL